MKTLLIGLLALCGVAVAQDVGRFKLHERIFEANAFVACRQKDHAVELIKLTAAGDNQGADSLFGRRVFAGECFVASGIHVVYKKQVYKQVGVTVFTVYEARVLTEPMRNGAAATLTFYVPMAGYVHEEKDA